MARKSNTHILLEDTYKERNPNGYWFEEDTMKFFKSKIHPELRKIDDLLYFIDSIKPPYGPREYNVKRMDSVGSIDTMYEGGTSYASCKKWLKEF